MPEQFELPLEGLLKVYEDLECAEVRQMHDKFGGPSENTPTVPGDHHDMAHRAKFMQEELNEFMEAAVEGDLVEMSDALIDIVYVAKGTAVMLGIPWGSLWDDVHRCNMRKKPGSNKKREGMSFDLVKPLGWNPPNTKQILKDYGFKE